MRIYCVACGNDRPETAGPCICQRKAQNMADNLGVRPKRAFSTEDEGYNYPIKARVLVSAVADINIEDTYIVWFTFTLGSWKALISTTAPDGRYYEVTYNKAKAETYVDVYKKENQEVFPDLSKSRLPENDDPI